MSTCRVISSVVGKGYLQWPVCSFDKTLIAFAPLHFVLQHQTYPLLHISLDFLLWHSKTLWWKGQFWGVLVQVGFVSLVFIELFDFSFLGISGWSIDLDYCDVGSFALETNQDHSVIFEVAPKYCILDSCWPWRLLHFFCEILPAVVDIMVIWIKFACSCPF